MALGAGALVWGAAVSAADLEGTAERIEAKLMAPCCKTNTIAVHESAVAHRMRLEIREMLAAGRSEREILDFFVERHGPQILAMPEARGLSLMPYVFPFAFLALAGVTLAVALRRWRRNQRREATASAAPPVPAGPYAERLRRELERLD